MRTTERDIKQTTYQKGNPDRRLHPFYAFPRNSPGHDWTNGRAYAASGKQDANSGGGTVPDREDSLAKYSQQGQDATAKSPGWFDHQEGKNSRSMLDVS